ncbi:phosphoenolpyruvate--protein phosphotransferase [Gemmatimonas sp.]|jgi:phosphocarrier protein FPr|uniref:phosphoenolpyruvate--protein phosphotransferase n=1 Tax=Gemmatimonas sp. TaxID=1962908 RepID=UPI0037BEE0AA
MSESTLAPTTGRATLTLLAPVSGVIVPLEDVPDPVFAQRLAGDGLSIDPLGSEVLAPCDAVVRQVHRASHAVTLEASGLEIVIHVGLDTVLLQGAGFHPAVKAGQQVRAGDVLLRFDIDAVARRARSLLTEVVISNMDRVAALRPRSGMVVAGHDVLFEVELKADPSAPAAPAAADSAITSAPVVVGARTGLHARPAAVVAAAARRFAADLRLHKDGQEANARSVVSIMALEVGGGDTLTVVGRGSDAAEAIQELVALLATDLDAGAAHGKPAHGQPAPARPAPVTLSTTEPVAEGVLRGVAASPGLAIGQVFHLRHDDAVVEQRGADPAQEQRAIESALSAAHVQLEGLRQRLTEEADADHAAIFAAHQELLEDPEVLDRAAAQVRAGDSAAWAWQQAYTSQADRLSALSNAVMRGRATDLRDVGRRVLQLLVGGSAPVDVPADSIVVAEDLTPSDTAALDRTKVRALCTTMGSATSHVAILARGLGLPAVAGVDPRILAVPAGTRVVVDGDRGTVNTTPSADDESRIVARQSLDSERRERDLAAAMEPATTTDGHRVEVVANIGAVSEGARVADVGGEGVGLLRSEFLFMDRRTAPDEDEQAKSYRIVARALGPERILVIRTLDVGGDKPLPYLDVAAELNPFLGERGVRLTLARPELFRTQVRAILRASASGKVAMMFPMIATLAEWRAAKALVEREREALGVAPIPVGIMVEIPAAALIAEQFAREADFFSIGTNDLTQYTMAMDRTNPRLAPQVDALHPSVLRLIERTVAGARAHGRWVGVCGALAGDLHAVPILIGLGVDELSADIPLVPAVKARVRSLSLAECRETARLALEAGDGAEVRAIVTQRHS